ncbi:hypothetical protein PV518_17580, partial [Streptomyces sp. ND04-05B]|nr:hypothetical protein [Streptomyces sp. ND04-05B]
MTRRVRIDLTDPERLGPGELGVVALATEPEQRLTVGTLMRTDDLVENRLVESRRRIPEHVR